MNRKSIITTALVAFASTIVNAQTQLKSNAHIGFVYPLSTNGVKAPEYANLVSLHALAGVSGAELGFCGAGVASIVRDSVNGFIASGILNVVGGNTDGCQAAGVANISGKNVKGAQLAGVLNMADTVDGLQAAGFVNIATGHVNGAQVAGFANIADSVNTPIGGFVNITGDANTQVGGFLNIAEHVKGAQVAGFVNIAEQVDGAQIAGFINIAGKVKGLQLAGFVNIADSSDCPIGLINIIGNGEVALGVSVNEIGTTLATFRSGGRTLYGILGVGGNFVDGYSAIAFQAGMGMHVPVYRSFRFNMEATVTSLSNRWYHTDIRSGFKVMPSLRFGNVEVFAGPSFSYTTSADRNGLGRVGYSVWSRENYHYAHDLSIGVEGGVQFHLATKKLAEKIISKKIQ
jgi:hypothetical protein